MDPDTNSGGVRPNSGGARSGAGAPVGQSGGPRPNAGGPRANSGGYRPGSGGSRPNTGGAREGAGGARRGAGGPREGPPAWICPVFFFFFFGGGAGGGGVHGTRAEWGGVWAVVFECAKLSDAKVPVGTAKVLEQGQVPVVGGARTREARDPMLVVLGKGQVVLA